MSALLAVDLLVIAVLGFGAIYVFRKYPGEPKDPTSTRGQLPADFKYEDGDDA